MVFSFGNMPTTLVRRLIFLFSRSIRLDVDQRQRLALSHIV